MSRNAGTRCKAFAGPFAVTVLLAAFLGLQMLDPLIAGAAEIEEPARGVFLVASRRIQDPRFRQTVILLLNVDHSGAAGLIINKPLDTKLSGLFREMGPAPSGQDRLHFGGPVESHRLFVLVRTRKTDKDLSPVIDGVSLAASQSAIADTIRQKRAGEDFRVFSGYAGWIAGQLEREIRRGDWILTNADADSVFHGDETKVWLEMLRRSEEIVVRYRERGNGPRSPSSTSSFRGFSRTVGPSACALTAPLA
jgi:putative transcriptional regulator